MQEDIKHEAERTSPGHTRGVVDHALLHATTTSEHIQHLGRASQHVTTMMHGARTCLNLFGHNDRAHCANSFVLDSPVPVPAELVPDLLRAQSHR